MARIDDTPSLTASVHELTVTLRDVRPAVWRRLEVPSAITLGELHDVLQDAFDWDGDHLHDFRVRGTRFTPVRSDLFGPPWFGEEPRDEDVTPLVRVAPRPGDILDYTYDFGDDWRHRIVVDAVGPAAPDGHYPRCTAGSGLAPEEDTGAVRPGRFDDLARQRLNGRLRRAGAVTGRELSADAAVEIDPVFTGLFLDLIENASGECPCGCGASSGSGSGSDAALPALHRASDDELAALAADSPLVRRAVALATWLGTGRALTASRVLRPADAVAVADELDLAAALLPRSDGPGSALDMLDDDDDVDAEDSDLVEPSKDDARPAQGALDLLPGAGRREVSRRTIRSAKDLPYLHPLWVGCVAAGLIAVRGGKAYPGPGLQVWQEPADPARRVESWATLLAGYLRTRDDAARADRGYFGGLDGQVLQASIPLLYALAHDPIPLGALSLAGADLDDLEDLPGPGLLMLPVMVAEMSVAVEDWLVAGVVEVAAADEGGMAAVLGETIDELQSGLREQLALMAAGPAGPESAAEMGTALSTVVDALVAGPALRLTPLGAYGLARVLAAHGWDVPASGACADVEPVELLDRLMAYIPRDAIEEATGWLAARGDRWAEALREVIWSAAVKGDDGPPRRAVLPAVLCAAGPPVVPILDAVQGDPWLSAVVASIRHALEIGPEPTLAQRLWLEIDGLSLVVEDPDEFEEALEDSSLLELLAERGGVAAAAGSDHPHARDVLRAAVPHVEDRQLVRALRKALTGGSGNPALRALGGRDGGSRSRRKRR
ncbi:MAG TPA: plasmid pRiA4b ORF-3 family protein [Kineosporiaceae bacterium]|nr:plasmid pRiA4b ORF-3 family protein [Kineosporiaceae bacterium]